MGTQMYEANAVLTSTTVNTHLRRTAIISSIILIAVKMTEYLTIGTVNPIVVIFNLALFLTGGVICLGSVNYICYLCNLKFELPWAIRLYLVTSLIIVPVSLTRIWTVVSGETLRPSYDGLTVKLIQVVGFILVFMIINTTRAEHHKRQREVSR